MSKTFADLQVLALKNRDEYGEIERAIGGQKWDVLHRTAGLVGDVGDLTKLVMAKQGLCRFPKVTDDLLAHELSDCLWSIMVIANELEIDLEQAFVKTMDEFRVFIDQEKREVLAL